MNQARGFQGFQADERIAHQPQGEGLRQPSTLAGHEAQEVAARGQFQGHVQPAIRLASVVTRDDEGRTELRHGPCLGQEAFAEHRIDGQLGRHQLEGDFAVEGFLDGPVDRGHATRAQLAKDTVRPDARGDRIRHVSPSG